MFTLPELIEYFEGQYTEVQVIEALNKIQASPDQDGLYPNAVVQGLEAAFNISQEAARKLPGGNVRDAQNLAIELAQNRAIELDLDANTLNNVVELIVSEGMAEAVFKHQLKQQVMEKVTADLESQSLMGLTDRNAQKIATIATILSDPDNLDKIIQDFGGTSQEQVVQRQQTLAADSTFDVEAFFTEVEGKKKANNYPSYFDQGCTEAGCIATESLQETLQRIESSRFMKWLERNPANAVYFFAFCVCLVIASPNIKSNMTAMGEVQKLTQNNSARQMRLFATQQFVESQGEIADSRYKSGCIMVVASNSPDSLTALEEGKPVMDAARKRPLSAGAVVCDGFGNTGVIVEIDKTPVVGEMAFTGNETLINAAKKRANKRFSLPRT